MRRWQDESCFIPFDVLLNFVLLHAVFFATLNMHFKLQMADHLPLGSQYVVYSKEVANSQHGAAG
jgi:hypothetical protein